MPPVRLAGRSLDAAGVERDCAIECTSLDDLEIVGAATAGTVGRVVCHVPGLGILTGHTRPSTATSIGLALEAGTPQRRRLAARLRWHQAQAEADAERRVAVRVVPARADVSVTWGGIESPGKLRDVSSNGASVDIVPRSPLGSPVALGRRRATVVRHTDTGIGVMFALPLSPENVTEEVVL